MVLLDVRCLLCTRRISHLACLVEGSDSRVFAFDKSKKRCALLQRRMEAAGASQVSARNVDFLTLDPNDPEYAHVRGSVLIRHWCGVFVAWRL